MIVVRVAGVLFRPAGLVAACWLAAAATFWLPVGPDLVTTEELFFDLRDPLVLLVLMTGNVIGLAWWSERRMRRDSVAPPRWARGAVFFGTVVLLAAVWTATTMVDGQGRFGTGSPVVSVVLAIVGAATLAAGTGAWCSLHAIAGMAVAGWTVALVRAAYLLVWVAPGFELEPGACFSGMDCIGFSSPQTEVTWLAIGSIPLMVVPAIFQLLVLIIVSGAGPRVAESPTTRTGSHSLPSGRGRKDRRL